MYFLKTQGTDKIPDYVQIRDDNFVLLAHFKTNHPENQIQKFGLTNYEQKIKQLIETSPFGILYKL
ncbi:MAG: fructose-6-phosphate aldolase [Bacteroidetes bacterium]|nr:fructose-6-phosphate aldolase [Bacteroidota bacterium]